MMKRYAGLCVGGPLAGQRLEAEGPGYCVPVRINAPLTPPDAVSMTDVIHTYTFHRIDGVGFWFEQGRPTSDMMVELAAAYEGVHDRVLKMQTYVSILNPRYRGTMLIDTETLMRHARHRAASEFAREIEQKGAWDVQKLPSVNGTDDRYQFTIRIIRPREH